MEPEEAEAEVESDSDYVADGEAVSIVVNMAGTLDCNGEYLPDGVANRRVRYKNLGTEFTLSYFSGCWLICQDYKGQSWYGARSRAGIPPAKGWSMSHNGESPVPDLRLQRLERPREATPEPEAVPLPEDSLSMEATAAAEHELSRDVFEAVDKQAKEMAKESRMRRRLVSYWTCVSHKQESQPDIVWVRLIRQILDTAPVLATEGRPQPQPAALTSWLYLGGVEEAKDLARIKLHKIEGVINLAPQACRNEGHDGYGHVHPSLAPKLLTIDALDDATYPLIDRHLSAIVAFAEEFREKGKRLLVHCHAGVNRSTTLCVAYLMHRHRMPLLDIIRQVVRKRGMVLSNATFVEQLVRLARRLRLLKL